VGAEHLVFAEASPESPSANHCFRSTVVRSFRISRSRGTGRAYPRSKLLLCLPLLHSCRIEEMTGPPSIQPSQNSLHLLQWSVPQSIVDHAPNVVRLWQTGQYPAGA